MLKEVNKDMVIGDMLRKNPTLAAVLMNHGMACVGCPASQMETIEQASQVHNIDLDSLINDLNAQIAAAN